MKKLLAAFTGVGLVHVLFACDPPFGSFANCTEQCVNATARRVCFTTRGDDTFEGEEQPCPDGTRCVESVRSNGHPYAACTAGDIDPECKRDEDISFCDGNDRVRCKGHYREETVGCGDGVCAEIDDAAKCVRSREPDPHCDADAGPSDPQTGFCDGDTLVGCFGPYAIVGASCAAEGKFCRVVGGAATCRLQSEPDPRCDDTRAPFDFYCDGDVAVKCVLGWREATLDCAAEGRRCVTRSRPESNVPNVRCE